MLAGTGCDEATVNRVQVLLRRATLDARSGTQALEDAASLAFLETQLGALADRLDDEHMASVVQKVAAKMSAVALTLVPRIPLDERGSAVLARALA